MCATNTWNLPAWGDAELAGLARQVAGDVTGSLALAQRLEGTARALDSDTWPVLSPLATLGSVDLTTARVVEPHWEAVAILGQAGAPVPGGPPGACTRHPRPARH